MAVLCACCKHPGRELIDAFCLNRVATLDSGDTIKSAVELMDALARLYPGFKPPSESSISKHSTNHIVKSTSLQLIDGTLCDARGKALPGYGVTDVLRAVINLAFANILEHPEKVTVTQLLDAMRLLAQIEGGTRDRDEYERAWLDLNRSNDEKRSRRRIKRVQDIDDDTAIEGEIAQPIAA